MLILFCSYMSQVFWAWPFVHRPICHLLWSCFCLEDGVGWKSLPHDFFGCECSSRKTFPGKEGSFGSENLVNAGKENLPFHVLRSIPGSPPAPIKNQRSSYSSPAPPPHMLWKLSMFVTGLWLSLPVYLFMFQLAGGYLINKILCICILRVFQFVGAILASQLVYTISEYVKGYLSLRLLFGDLAWE